MLSFRTMFDSKAAAGFEASVELRLGDDRFHAEVARGRLELARGSADRPDAVLSAGPDTLSALVYGGRKLAEALRSGDVKVEATNRRSSASWPCSRFRSERKWNSSRSEAARR